ncbi:MFS general substrate transporter [Xylaria intraflava]|nr:MFS general substrate transporter [Xylaria intraflava]
MASRVQPRTHGRAEIVMIDADDIGVTGLTETTSLLGAGAEQQQPDDLENDATYGPAKQHYAGHGDFEGLPWWKTPSVFWLLLPYALASLTMGGMIVPRIELIVTLVCRHYYAEQQTPNPDGAMISLAMGESNPQCNSAAVQKDVATFTLVLSAVSGGLSAFIAPKLGSLSDRYGRTQLVAIASCGGIMNEIITIVTAKYPSVFDYRFLIFGTFFDGITGSFTAIGVLSNSYVSDCSPPSKRGVSLGYLQACLFTGLALGPILAGKIVLWTGSVLSIFYINLGCHMLAILLFWFIVPESLSKKRQMMAQEKHRMEQQTIRVAAPGSAESVFTSRPQAWITGGKLRPWLLVLLRANPLAPLKMFAPSGRENRRLRRNLLLLAFIESVLMFASLGAGTVLILYAKFMFDWGPWESSRFISIVSFFRVIILLVIFPAINYFFRIRPLRHERKLNGNLHAEETHSGADNLDIWLIRFALLSDMVGMMGYVFVRTGELFIASAVCTSFGGLATATISSVLSKQVPAERVGTMLGALGLMTALDRLFAPIVFDGIYAGTIGTFPQAFLVILASLFGLSILASLFVRPHLVLVEESYTAVPERETAD